MNTKTLRWSIVLAVAGTLALPGLAYAGIGYVNVEASDQNKFSPRSESYNLLAHPNFWWQWGDDSDGGVTLRKHNVRQDDGLFRSGDPTKSPPDGHYELNVSAGTFPYYCEVHGGPGGAGMSGKIHVAPVVEGSPTTSGIELTWADVSSETGDAYDVRYRVDGRNWRIWKNDTPHFGGTFGAGGHPIVLKTGHTYKFQVRSEKGSNPDRRSDWSPTRSQSL